MVRETSEERNAREGWLPECSGRRDSWGESQIPEITRGRRGGEARSARGEPASVCGGEPGEGTQVGAAGCKGPGVPKEVGGGGEYNHQRLPHQSPNNGGARPWRKPSFALAHKNLSSKTNPTRPSQFQRESACLLVQIET